MKVRRLDATEPNRRGEDDSQEPHPAERRPEELRVLGPARADDVAAREEDGHRLDAADERPLDVVGFAVDVVRDAPTDRHVLRPRGDHGEPAARGVVLDDPREAQPGVAGEEAFGGVEPEIEVEPAHAEDLAPFVERGVAVAPSEPRGTVPPAPAAARAASLIRATRVATWAGLSGSTRTQSEWTFAPHPDRRVVSGALGMGRSCGLGMRGCSGMGGVVSTPSASFAARPSRALSRAWRHLGMRSADARTTEHEAPAHRARSLRPFG